MTHSYTYKHQNNLSNELLFDEMPIKDEDIAEVTFRPFSESLTFLMKNAGYTGKDTPTDKAAFVIEALYDIGLDVTHKPYSTGLRVKPSPAIRKTVERLSLPYALHYILTPSRSNICSSMCALIEPSTAEMRAKQFSHIVCIPVRLTLMHAK